MTKVGEGAPAQSEQEFVGDSLSGETTQETPAQADSALPAPGASCSIACGVTPVSCLSVSFSVS